MRLILDNGNCDCRNIHNCTYARLISKFFIKLKANVSSNHAEVFVVCFQGFLEDYFTATEPNYREANDF